MKRKLLRLVIAMVSFIWILIGTGFNYLRRMPAPDVFLNTYVVFYDIHGEPFLEEVIPNRRQFAPLDEISSYVIDGFIATEDRNFWEHHGFYYPSILRSVIANVRAGDHVQGGSTITQQYARNLMVDFERTVARKLREAAYTIRLEESHDKAGILEGYLNTINFGHGVYGIGDAAQFYFGVDAYDLTLAQASILVGIPKGPSVYSPLNHYENARERQLVVLDAMVETEKINAFEKEAALAKTLTFIGRRPVDASINYYFVDAVLREAEQLLDETLSSYDELRIFTTLDPNIQMAVNDAVDTNIADGSALQSVVVVMEPETGHVLALSGGSDYGTSQFNRALFAERQVGSLMKPILYIAALEHGFNPSTAFISRPTTFMYNGGEHTYTPGNYMDLYAFEEISMANALAVSDNIFAVKTHDFLGMHVLKEMAARFGISAEIDEVPSAALGVTNVNMMEMTEAYGVFANEGRKVTHRFVTQIKDDQEVLVDNRPVNVEQVQVVSITDTFILNEMMTGMFNLVNNNHLAATGLSIIPQLTHRYAGKTGSTDTDSWMIGYTPDLVTTVWVGYDDNVKIGEDAVIAKLIWADVMEDALHQGSRWFREPGDVVSIPVDARNGLPVDAMSPRKVNLYFQQGNEPY
ncbi:MAG: transglycosylase domain-containing protein [Defluviitaleaceae bacterium]|nr:transglycosylase domain-containing protein [Defluviitaleaceae bacterium]